ncbi:MAG: hypothetical protein KBG28_29375 [Kofleriaceae bacterium]|nr:hypothetical protein [Kofleriaceae bacterium]
MRLSNRTGGLVFLIGVALLGCDEQAADKATTGAAGSGSGAGSAGGSAGGAGSGGGTGAKGPATTGGAYAKSLAAFCAKEHPGLDCPVYALGQEFTVGDWSLRVDGVSVHEAESKLPWITNVEERSWFARPGRRALVVRFAVRNDAPIKRGFSPGMRLYSSDGQQATWFPYNLELYQKDHGLAKPPRSYPPGAWVERAGVLGVAEGAADHAALWVRDMVSQYDPTDPRGRRKIQVLKHTALVDLGPAKPGPHLNPEKRTP